MIEKVERDKITYAIIIRRDFSSPGISFVTPDEYSQQLAYMQHPKGKIISPHIHNPVVREIKYTQEVLVIKSGKLRVDLYDSTQHYLESKILEKGDIILLVAGGHGFEVLESIDMIEIKQGPYQGEEDKTRFMPILQDEIKVS
jgi:mannose-6-phosphate isomerase-like protein (cupin superfamily)